MTVPVRPTPPISRLVLAGIAGTSLSGEERRRLARLRPGGIVLFRRNVGTVEELCALTGELRAVLGERAILAIDQEGGRVARLRAPFTGWPPMRAVGRHASASLARAVGARIGAELAAVGIDCDFAPVLDVDSNPANPIIGDRSFGRDPRAVARLALAFAAGLASRGVLACGKHFPGHGDTDQDSHLALPVVRRERRDLERLELLPFRRAAARALPMLMTAHVVYPALDPDRPATLSPRILRRLLRRELAYTGVIASDDLAMHALDAYGSLERLAADACAAGCDLLLACQSLEESARAISGLRRAFRDGRLSASRVADALRRVERLARSRTPIPADPRRALRLLSDGRGADLAERIAEAPERTRSPRPRGRTAVPRQRA